MTKLTGFYRGKVLNLPLGWIWQGKKFGDDTVINKILGFYAVTGKLKYTRGKIFYILYPGGLEDTLIEVMPDFYLGELKLWKFTIYFTLEYEGNPKEIQTQPTRISQR